MKNARMTGSFEKDRYLAHIASCNRLINWGQMYKTIPLSQTKRSKNSRARENGMLFSLRISPEGK